MIVGGRDGSGDPHPYGGKNAAESPRLRLTAHLLPPRSTRLFFISVHPRLQRRSIRLEPPLETEVSHGLVETDFPPTRPPTKESPTRCRAARRSNHARRHLARHCRLAHHVQGRRLAASPPRRGRLLLRRRTLLRLLQRGRQPHAGRHQPGRRHLPRGSPDRHHRPRQHRRGRRSIDQRHEPERLVRSIDQRRRPIRRLHELRQ